MFFVADNQWRAHFCHALEPTGCLLEQGILAGQSQELFGVHLAGKRPEPGAGSAAEDYWNDHI